MQAIACWGQTQSLDGTGRGGGGPTESGVTSADIELSWNIHSLKTYSLPMTREGKKKMAGINCGFAFCFKAFFRRSGAIVIGKRIFLGQNRS